MFGLGSFNKQDESKLFSELIYVNKPSPSFFWSSFDSLYIHTLNYEGIEVALDILPSPKKEVALINQRDI